jgi:hypothetical protein
MLMPIIVQYLPQLLPMLLQAMFNRPAYVAETKTGMSTAATVGAGAGVAGVGGILGALLTAFFKGP